MANFRLLNANNGMGGGWYQGTGGDDSTHDGVVGRDGKGVADALSGNDQVLGMGGDDVIVDTEGANKIYGGAGSERIVVEVGGNLIHGDAAHPKEMDPDTAPAWAAWGDDADTDLLQYHPNPTGIFVTGVNYWSTLGKELREYGFDNAKKGGTTAAYTIQNNDGDRMNYWEVQEGRESKGADDYEGDSLVADLLATGKIDIAVGIEQLTGTDHRDTFLLRHHDDYVSAKGGNDWISTNGGDDFIVGGAGNDQITTGNGLDTVRFVVGQDGHDHVRDFDVKTRDSETDWDSLSIYFKNEEEGFMGQKTWLIDTAQELADFIVYLEKDGDVIGDTDAQQDGNDIILDFDGSSIRLKDTVDDLMKAEFDAQPTEVNGNSFLWSDVIDMI